MNTKILAMNHPKREDRAGTTEEEVAACLEMLRQISAEYWPGEPDSLLETLKASQKAVR